MNEYSYSGNLSSVLVDEVMGDEGILVGQWGRLHYRKCNDGFSIINSYFKGSGFYVGPSSVDMYFPKTINDIPVIEVRQDVSIASKHPIVIEGGSLKRVFLNISYKSFSREMSEASQPMSALIMHMLRDQEGTNQEESALNIELDFCNASNSVEYCEISCNRSCILEPVSTVELKVNSPKVVLRGKAYKKLKRAIFSGKVYPSVELDWEGYYQEINHFSELNELKEVDGSLRGDTCWSFKNCISLERVHLSEGIKKIAPYSFYNCSSLTDLYIPDTVTEIGEYAFAECKGLRTIHLPSDILAVSKGMFKNCSSLQKCFLSDSIEVIEDEAFAGCVSLKRPWIPKNIKKLSDTAFDIKL